MESHICPGVDFFICIVYIENILLGRYLNKIIFK